MPISYQPMRDYMKEHKISYYYLNTKGIHSNTLQRIRQPAGVHRFHAGRFKTLIICRVKNSLHPYAYVIKQSRYTDLQIHSDLNRALPPQYLLKKVFPFLF